MLESLPNQIGPDFKCMTFVPMKPPVLIELLLQVESHIQHIVRLNNPNHPRGLRTNINSILSWKNASVSQCLKPD